VGNSGWPSGTYLVPITGMKEIIKAGVQESISRSKKPVKKKVYKLSGTKQRIAASALKVLGALNTLNKALGSINSHARRVVFKNILPEWLKDVVHGDRAANAFTVSTDDAKVLIVPMKKYGIINEERAGEILDLKEKYGIDLDIEEVRHFEFNERLVDLIPEEKMDELVEELKKALLGSKVLTPAAKKEIRSGKIPVIEEHTTYKSGEDVLSNLTRLSKGDPKKAEAIINAVQPVFSMRSFEMDHREVQVEQALDLIKESIHEIPEEEL
jgi:hypothetical protein